MMLAYISFKFNRGFFHSLVWYMNIQSSLAAFGSSGVTLLWARSAAAAALAAAVVASFFRGDRNSVARTSRSTSVSLANLALVKSSNHSTITVPICSLNVSCARRTVTPISTCTNAAAVSIHFLRSAPISTTSLPCSSTLMANAMPSSRVRPVVSATSRASSSKLCLSSFQMSTVHISRVKGSEVGWVRTSASECGTPVSSGEASNVERRKSRAIAMVACRECERSEGRGRRLG
jgi:hypothetical protein